MTEKLMYIRDLLKKSFLPKLNCNFDEFPMDEKAFKGYHQMLEINLPILYDFVQKNLSWIFETKETAIKEVQACLIVLLCELTASTAMYKPNNEQLLRNGFVLLQSIKVFDNDVESYINRHYESKLEKSQWKSNIGSIHGFLRFLEWRYNGRFFNCKIPSKRLNFFLFVGLMFRESHDPISKQMGIRIFNIILNHAQFKDVQSQNVHGVIYNEVFRDVSFMDTVEGTRLIWSCLYKCLDYFEKIESSTWSQVDDMLEELTKYICLAPNSSISCCMLEFITKFFYYFTLNRQEIKITLAANLSDPVAIVQCRKLCQRNTSCTIYRWAKKLLDMFLVVSYKLMESKIICQQLLLEMHRCFMVAILPIPLPIVEPHLMGFFDKFTSVLMEVIVTYNRDPIIVQMVKCILETFLFKVKNPIYCDGRSKKLQGLCEAFEKLLAHSVFNS